MNDIVKIKEELVSHLKVELPYTFSKETHIKYLTLKDEDELFYRGGKFCCQKGNCIYLYNSGRKWKVPINYYDNDGNIVYTTTFFIKNSDEEIKESDKDNKRKDEIILAQQDLIKKLTQKIRELEYHLMMNDS
jgi:magnesium-transporting ATPase (P-type)